jgi:metal-sulfur cluster biosynthetic enzyme
MPAETETLEHRARALLDGIGDPCSVASGTPMGIDEMGLIKSVELADDGCLHVAMRLTAPLCHNVGYFNVEIKQRLAALPGVSSVSVSMDHGLEWTPDLISADAQGRRQRNLQLYGISLR